VNELRKLGHEVAFSYRGHDQWGSCVWEHSLNDDISTGVGGTFLEAVDRLIATCDVVVFQAVHYQQSYALLKLMKDAGKTAYGIEINQYDVQLIRKESLTVVNEDVLAHLQKLQPESLGGVFSAQVVEHLAPEKAYNMILRLHQVMKSGGRLVIETVNPLSFYAFHHMYLKDPTHVFPVHPETLAFFVKYAGFHDVRIESISPVPEKELLPGPGPEIQDAALHSYLSLVACNRFLKK